MDFDSSFSNLLNWFQYIKNSWFRHSLGLDLDN